MDCKFRILPGPADQPASPPNWRKSPRAADEANFASLWVMDHFFQIGGRNPQSGLGPAEDEMLEGYSVLSYLAGITKKVKLGTMVTGVVYRHPGILAKTVTTLDVLSGGRAYLGIGAAWNEREALGLGVPFPPVAERFERLEEALQIVLQMWSGQRTPYHGRALPARRDFEQPAAADTAPPAHFDRWLGREEDPAPGRPVCRRMQLVRGRGCGSGES